MSFSVNQVLPGVWHIQDCMGVCMTLLAGTREALLVDTGYGLEDVHAQVRAITSLPLTVLLTHAHHDHALGARWFSQVSLFPQDQPYFDVYTGPARRRMVLESAAQRGIPVSEDDFLSAAMPVLLPARQQTMDLGGLHAKIILCPGHTPGSAVVFVPERDLLLTGDNWNPCTWLFFPEALPILSYRENMRSLLSLPFQQVLCAHQPGLYPRTMVQDCWMGLTKEALRSARPVSTGAAEGVRTAEVSLPHDQVLIFDRDKLTEDLEKLEL